jgi:hypothetical protein
MRRYLIAVALVLGAITANTASADDLSPDRAPPQSPPLQAPVGHAQPTPDGFLSPADENPTEDQRLQRSDAREHRMDEKLDRELNICRC